MFKKPSASTLPPGGPGFTLLELLITVAIMVVVIGGSLAGFMTFQSRQQVLTATKNVQQLMRTTQGKARVRETPTSCNSPGNRLQGYRIAITNTAATIYALCGADTSIRGAGSLTPIQVYAENYSGVTYSGPATIEFYTLYRGLDFTSGNKTLQFTNGSNSFFFTVSPGGAISEVQ